MIKKGECMENKINSILKKLDYDVYLVRIIKKSNCSFLYYNFDEKKNNKEKFNLIKDLRQKIKFISQYEQLELDITSGDETDFIITYTHSNENNIVKFDDKKYDYLKDIVKPEDIFFGVDKEGIPRVYNLVDMPHILIAGATGSGKSVMINNIICSLIKYCEQYRKPNFYMIDTKQVELSPYQRLNRKKNSPNLERLATNVDDALDLLFGITCLIEAKYEVMKQRNQKFIGYYMPKDVVIIDELADLMISSNKEAEEYIVKIAQLGRACGVHLIVATQNPVVKVLSGLIKANLPCRIALKTSSGIESRNILDHNGAELLNGKGDFLLKLPSEQSEIRLQCPYVSIEDINNIIDEYNNM